MSDPNQSTDLQTLVKQYMSQNAKVADAPNVLEITPAGYSRVIASRTP
jgi:hypothetical protein